jgi:hypothetical protein
VTAILTNDAPCKSIRISSTFAPSHMNGCTEAETLAELCTLAAYHPSGFTHTKEMQAVCKVIADRHSPAARRACLARADERERAFIRR